MVVVLWTMSAWTEGSFGVSLPGSRTKRKSNEERLIYRGCNVKEVCLVVTCAIRELVDDLCPFSRHTCGADFLRLNYGRAATPVAWHDVDGMHGQPYKLI